MYDIIIKIIIILFILGVCFIIFKIYNNNFKFFNSICKIDNFDIDDLVVIKRTPEYSKLINKLVDDKSFIFNESQLKSLKNSQQIFKLSNNKQDISNISDMVYNNCINETNTYDINEYFTNNYTGNNINNYDDQYNYIKNELENDIKIILEPNCTNIKVLQNNIPFSKNYLKNYYKDLYGNRIEANLKDYYVAYNTLINIDNDIGLPVNTQIGHSNFIIPDQYNYDNKFTNAYNIDWSRIINPIEYSA